MIITAGKFKGRKVTAPDKNITRPTLSKAREGIFSVLFSIMDFDGKSFLDVFGGSGIMGLEAFSRGFAEVCVMEKNIKAARIIKDNYKNLDLESNLLIGDSLKLLSKLNKSFDLIYMDPPYSAGIYEECLRLINQNEILNRDGIIVLEHVNKIDWEMFGFKLIKQKEYSKKLITFLSKE